MSSSESDELDEELLAQAVALSLQTQEDSKVEVPNPYTNVEEHVEAGSDALACSTEQKYVFPVKSASENSSKVVQQGYLTVAEPRPPTQSKPITLEEKIRAYQPCKEDSVVNPTDHDQIWKEWVSFVNSTERGFSRSDSIPSLPNTREQNRDWNADFQELFGQVAHTPHELNCRTSKMNQLVDDFVSCAQTVATIIVHETLQKVPVAKRVVKPIKVGGQAGGQKFRWGKILFKFATNWLRIYPDEKSAQKAAANELRAMSAITASNILHLRTTLTALIRLRGLIVYATALAPLDSSTLVFGSVNAGHTIHDLCPALRYLVKHFATQYNLAEHTLFDTAGREFRLHVGVDVEGHCGKDGRFYLIDLARVFPPIPVRPHCPRDFLFRLFRHEFVKQHCRDLPLSSDAYSIFGANDPKRRNHEETAEQALHVLRTVAVPNLVQELMATDVGSLVSARMASIFHRHGVNMHCLWQVRNATPCESTDLRRVLWLEVVARAVKGVIRACLRRFTQHRTCSILRHIVSLLFQEDKSALFRQRVTRCLQNDFDVPPHQALSLADFGDQFARRLVDVCNIDITVLGSSPVTVKTLLECELRLNPKVKRARVAEFPGLKETELQLEEELRLRQETMGRAHPSLADIYMRFLQLYKLWSSEEPEESLKKGQEFATELLALKANHPALLDVFERCGLFYFHFGLYEKALELFQKNVEEATMADSEAELAVSLHGLALVHERMGDYTKAAELFEKALKVERQVWSCVDVQADTLNCLGHAHISLGAYTRALQCFELSRSITQDRAAPSTASTLHCLGDVCAKLGEYKEAVGHYRVALRLKTKYFGPDHPALANTLDVLGQVLLRQGEHKEAKQVIEEGIRIKEKVFGHSHPSLALSLQCMGDVYFDQGDYAKALSFFQEAMRMGAEALQRNHPQVASVINSIGKVHARLGEFEQALQCFEEAIEIDRKTFGTLNHADIAASIHCIGRVHFKRGEHVKAVEKLTQALKIEKSVFGTSHPQTAATLGAIGQAFVQQGKLSQALQCFEQDLAISRTALGSNHSHIATTLSSIGQVLCKQGKAKRAMECFEQALAIEKKRCSSSSSVAVILNTMGKAHWKEGNRARALTCFNEALAIQRAEPDADFANTLFCVGQVEFAGGHFDKALELYGRALSVNEQLFGPDHEEVGIVHHAIAQTSIRHERYEQALHSFLEHIRIVETVLQTTSAALASSHYCVGLLRFKSGHSDDALEHFEKAAALQKKLFGCDHPEVATTMDAIRQVRASMRAT